MSRIIVPTLPPSMLLSSGGDHGGSAKYKVVVEGDLMKASLLFRAQPNWDEHQIFEVDRVGRPVNLYPTPQEVADFFGKLDIHAIEGRQDIMLTVDVETSGDHPLASKLLCVGVGYTDEEGEHILNIPFCGQHGTPYWMGHDEWVVRHYLGAALANPRLTKNFHNGGFDTVVLWSHGLPVVGYRFDTMQAHHCADSELPHNLGFVSSRYLQSRYWKDDVKGELAWLDMDPTQLRSYNLRDILSTMRVVPFLHRQLTEDQLWPVFLAEMRMVHLMARATIRGVAIDKDRRDSTAIDPKTGGPVGLGPQLVLQMNKALAALREIAGPTFDPMKPVELRWLLYDKLKLPCPKLTASGLQATDKEALMLLDIAADDPFQKNVLRQISLFRQGQKFKSTFVDGLTALDDGAFHPSWSCRTNTGRLASSPNFQNLSKRIKKIFRALPGRKLVGIDLSQAELRLMGYYANETTLLEMYRQDINVHTVNAALLFQLRCPPEATDNTNPQTDAYLRVAVQRYLGLGPGAYDAFPVAPLKRWKPTRVLAKNFEFGCFRATTRIAVLDERGAVPICEVKPGDMTWCWDGEKYVPTRVKHAWSVGRRQCIKVTVKDHAGKFKVLECTPDHMLVLRDGSKLAAGELRSGQRLMPFRRWEMKGYRRIDPTNTGTRVAEHRWVLGELDPKVHVHHENERELDNRPENLRRLTPKEHWAEHAESHAAGARRYYAENRTAVIDRLTSARVASPKWQQAIREIAARGRASYAAMAAAKPPCACGAKVIAKGLCKDCYNREYRFKKNHVVVSVESSETYEVWDLEVEHEAHNFALADSVFVSNSAYGAMPETIHGILRSKRDPDSLELMFGDLSLGSIEALSNVWQTKLRQQVVRYWDNIVRATREVGHYRCPISGRIRRYRDGFKRNEVINCLDAETEALTRRGWVRGFDLQRDDVLLTKNASTGELEWQGMTDLRLFHDYEGPLVELRHRDFDVITTPDHRWLVHDRKTGKDVCRTTTELNSNGMDGIHLTGERSGPGSSFTLDALELFGWALTDGHFDQRGISRKIIQIVQSPSANPEKCARIQGVLERLDVEHGYYPARKVGRCSAWEVRGAWASLLHTLFPSGILNMDFIAALNGDQARHLVKVMVLGDGDEDRHHRRLTCSTKEEAELFQALCVMAGFATTVKVIAPGRRAFSPKVQPEGVLTKKPVWIVNIRRRTRTQVLGSQRRFFEGRVPVWCPIVPNTYFVARRRSKVFISGNTPIQMGIAGWMNICAPAIQDQFDEETGGDALIVQQVHDALTVECHESYAKRAGEIMQETLSQPFDIVTPRGFGAAITSHRNARLPADSAKVGTWLDRLE